MPDMKYSSNEMAKKYSKIDNYVENNRTAIKEMYRQVGNPVFDDYLHNTIGKTSMIVYIAGTFISNTIFDFFSTITP